MPSSYSPNLRIELIASGEQANTWGYTTNTNLGTLIEQAICGQVALNLTTTAVTLTALNGASDQSRQMILNCSGSPGGTTTITAPAVSKVYIVANNVSDGSAVQIQTSGGAAVIIAAGTTKTVWCDGLDFHEATNSFQQILLSANPTTAYEAATKNYADTKVPLAGGTMTGALILNADPSVALGAATKQYVDTAITTYFASGTRIVFAQAAAPTGWTQDTSDTANNRMMRVVNTTGGGVGGSADPTVMNVVPSHTHGYSGSVNGATTGTYIADPGHAHGVYDPGHAHGGSFNPNYHVYTVGSSGAFGGNRGTTDGSGTGIGIYGSGTGTYIVDPGHVHYYSGYTDGGSSQTNWTPRYNNVIICQKN